MSDAARLGVGHVGATPSFGSVFIENLHRTVAISQQRVVGSVSIGYWLQDSQNSYRTSETSRFFTLVGY